MRLRLVFASHLLQEYSTVQVEWCTLSFKRACLNLDWQLLAFPVRKGGDPAPPSGRATLLRLSPSHQPHLRRLPPCGWVSDFG
jgi:hypothetical protein